MKKPRIIIADTDLTYIVAIQTKFVEEYYDRIDLEIITDKAVFQNIFSSPQSADILIVSEDLYENTLRRHNIGKIYLMTEQENVRGVQDNVDRIYKYTNLKIIFSRITGNGIGIPEDAVKKKSTQVVLFTSACGGVGKTTISLAISKYLSSIGKKVLYINADYLQFFQYLLKDKSPLADLSVYAKLEESDSICYEDIRNLIRLEQFYYFPPFKASLASLGIPFSVYENIAVAAKNSNEFDFIFLDTGFPMEDIKMRLLQIADRVAVITKQTCSSLFSVNRLVSEISGISDEKYIFICNDFDPKTDNYLISKEFKAKFIVSEYIDHISGCDMTPIETIAENSGIQRTAFLIM